MYIRSKKRKLNSGKIVEYAYLVSIKHRKTKTPKQKVKKYLGRIYKLEKKKNKTFKDFIAQDLDLYFKSNSLTKIKKDLIKLELLNYGFLEISKEVFVFNDFKVNLNKPGVLDKNKEISLEINNNFINSYTLNRILNYTPPKNLSQLQLAKEYANSLLSLGLTLQEDVFVGLFKKEFSKN
ncbi:hypothetical protein HYV88_03845 [Candidatus Woesearchaeota archaeon]|nr:hypothetical protein [Candidatus Woesearchaeota archaeon]